MLSPTDHAMYRCDGFIVLPDILTRDEVGALRRVTEEFVRDARSVAANDEIYDLEDSHSGAEPRVRRIKTPHLHHPEYAKAARHPKIVEVLKDLWGTVRFDTGKLNMKSGGRRAGRMAPGLGVLSAHERRSRRGRHHARRLRPGERPDDGDPWQPSRPGLRPSRAGRAVLRRARPGCL
jgi:Phytanoyl-CoA dioxygenase (PhyH)